MDAIHLPQTADCPDALDETHLAQYAELGYVAFENVRTTAEADGTPAPCAPSFSRITVTSQPGRRIVYVLAYLPEARGAGVNMIEEPLELSDLTVELRLDERPPRRVYLAPEEEALEFSIDATYATVRIPRIKGWAAVVFAE